MSKDTTERQAPDLFGRIVHEEVTRRIQAEFAPWAEAEEVKLRGYHRNELLVRQRAGQRGLQAQIDSLDRQRFDPGCFRATSQLAHRPGSMPGTVHYAPQPEPKLGISFWASLPTPFLSAHPHAEQVIQDAIALASERTGLALTVIRAVRGGSNYVIDGYLDPPKPVLDPEAGEAPPAPGP